MRQRALVSDPRDPYDSFRNPRPCSDGATVGLCPITEANLGDGIFNALRLLLRVDIMELALIQT